MDKPGERPRKTEDDADVDSERAVHQDNDRQEADKQANEDALRDYIADPDEESKPHVVHVSQDNLFSANLLSSSPFASSRATPRHVTESLAERVP